MENTKTGLNTFLSGIYKKMALGVAVTAITSFILLSTGPGWTVLTTIFSSQWYYYGIVAIELGLLWFIQISMHKLSKEKASALFYLYAILNGLTLTGIFLIYTGSSILTAFIAAVVVFGTLAVVGTKTEKDLTGWGSFLMIGMWAVFIVSIINIFMQSSMMDMVISAVAVLVFSGLTLYDAQVYKKYYLQSEQGVDHGKMTT
ncbi:MAG: Bax inhibitor-1/YccA family protein, partial [Minisyncoccia bacterium]